MTPEVEFHHRSMIVDDGKPEVEFRWHWPRGVLDRRMSAFELTAFLFPHMDAIVPLLASHPHIQAEFVLLRDRLLLGRAVIDELVHWCQPVLAKEEDDLIILNLRSKRAPPARRSYSDLGSAHRKRT